MQSAGLEPTSSAFQTAAITQPAHFAYIGLDGENRTHLMSAPQTRRLTFCPHLDVFGAPQGIRTLNICSLSATPLPVGLEEHSIGTQ